ncbi:hypothetical protein [Bacillus alveayuensis]|uniref:Cu/Ag efflux protein CusF n=1 Tax=Aeribacillus alveayuensis TaxID=279215 RepID=A0ABT9VPG8_9BACI|nr:hypothetical protein [Bacillus alveayuensis]MDQ0162737.1 Cu/Ag efflux protein CusF [Bacillus alveayuensis]
MTLELKKKILALLLFILFVLLIIKYFVTGIPTFHFFDKSSKDVLMKLPESETITLKNEKEYKVFYCEITKVQDDTYFAQSKDGFKFSFTEESLDEPLKQSLKEGDIIKAYFDISSSVNGLSKVEKIK